jgi:hypothetical protein
MSLRRPCGVAHEPARSFHLCASAIPAACLRLVDRTGETRAAADDLFLRRLQPDLMDQAPNFGGAGYRVQWLLAATLEALLVGKAVLVTDKLPFMHRFDGSPMIQPILFKSAVYWLCVLIVRLAEGLIHFLAAGGAISDFPAHLVERFSWPQFLVIQVWLMVLFLVYVTTHELNVLIGGGELYRLFFRWRSSEAKLTGRQRIRLLARLNRLTEANPIEAFSERGSLACRDSTPTRFSASGAEGARLIGDMFIRRRHQLSGVVGATPCSISAASRKRA